MNKLKIADFKSARLPKMAELNVTGGIGCGEDVDAVADNLWKNNRSQYYATCETDIQCTNQDGSIGTDSYDCDGPDGNNQP